MKKNLFLFLALFIFAGSSFAQDKSDSRRYKAVKADHQKQTVIKKAVISGLNTRAAEVPSGVPVGLTNYDLQSNTTVARRLVNHGGGVLTTAWTQYHGDVLPDAPERGTGYNYNDGTGWAYATFSGNTKVEGSQRTGWPALVGVGGNDYIVNHFNGSGGYFGWEQTRGASNTGWSQKNATADKALLWPRAAASGNYIHTFGVVDVDITHNGQSPAPVYLRSTDGGSTWGSLVTLPGCGAADFDGISGDSYSMDANGSTVAIVACDLLSDFALWKSTDNGDTWTKTIICDSPSDQYDWEGGAIIDADGDQVADTMLTVSNAAVVVDGNGMVHVAFASLTILDDDATDGAASYFSGYQNGIHYWNDDMSAGVYSGSGDMDAPGGSNHGFYMSDDVIEYVGWTPDLNNDETIDDGNGGQISGGSYGFHGWADFPSLAVTPTDEIVLTYSTVMEGAEYQGGDNTNPANQSYRHIFMTKITWGDGSDAVAGQTVPLDITTVDGVLAENMYCTLARDTDADKCHVQFMWDGEPGVNMRTESDDSTDPVTQNYLIYKAVDFSDLVDFELFAASTPELNRINVSIFPNPTSTYVQISNVKNSQVEIYNITGQKVLSLNDYNGDQISVSNLANGTYTVRVITNEGIATEKIQIVK